MFHWNVSDLTTDGNEGYYEIYINGIKIFNSTGKEIQYNFSFNTIAKYTIKIIYYDGLGANATNILMFSVIGEVYVSDNAFYKIPLIVFIVANIMIYGIVLVKKFRNRNVF